MVKKYLLILLLGGFSPAKTGVDQTPNSQVDFDEKLFNELTILREEGLIDDVQLINELEKLEERGKLNFEQRIELARLQDDIRNRNIRLQDDIRNRNIRLQDIRIPQPDFIDWEWERDLSLDRYFQEQLLLRQHEQQSNLQN